MSTLKVRPSSIDGIKRLAKRIASEKSLKHTAALEEAARIAGYQTFLHAKRSLARATEPAAKLIARRHWSMNTSDFHKSASALWVEQVNLFASTGDQTMSWEGIDDIIRVLSPFMGANNNHAHLPTGGGFDFLSVRRSPERGCIEFKIFTEASIIVKPRRLVLERLASDPSQSFLMLELSELLPAINRDGGEMELARRHRQEELLDLGGAEYVDLDSLDDEDIPDEARQVLRFFDGQIMFVNKGSIWNASPKTYNGIHDKGTHSEVRQVIQGLSDKVAAAE